MKKLLWGTKKERRGNRRVFLDPKQSVLSKEMVLMWVDLVAHSLQSCSRIEKHLFWFHFFLLSSFVNKKIVLCSLFFKLGNTVYDDYITTCRVFYCRHQFWFVFPPLPKKKGWLTFFVMGKQVSPNIGGEGLLKISSYSVFVWRERGEMWIISK